VRALRARRGVRFSVAPRRGTFRVDVFESARGRSVVRTQRLVARFRGRRAAFTWNGRGQGGRRIRDGYLIARVVSTRPAGGSDVKRFALRRVNGRYSVRSAYDRTSQCGLLRVFRASRPAFGGRTERPLDIAYRVDQRASVSIAMVRGKRVIRRFTPRTRDANRTYKQRLTALRVPRGDIRVVVTAKAGKRAVTTSITARRL